MSGSEQRTDHRAPAPPGIDYPSYLRHAQDIMWCEERTQQSTGNLYYHLLAHFQLQQSESTGDSRSQPRRRFRPLRYQHASTQPLTAPRYRTHRWSNIFPNLPYAP